MRIKRNHLNRIGGNYYLILPDPMAGLKNRYTVYRIPVRAQDAVIIGRELDLKTARKVVLNERDGQ